MTVYRASLTPVLTGEIVTNIYFQSAAINITNYLVSDQLYMATTLNIVSNTGTPIYGDYFTNFRLFLAQAYYPILETDTWGWGAHWKSGGTVWTEINAYGAPRVEHTQLSSDGIHAQIFFRTYNPGFNTYYITYGMSQSYAWQYNVGNLNFAIYPARILSGGQPPNFIWLD